MRARLHIPKSLNDAKRAWGSRGAELVCHLIRALQAAQADLAIANVSTQLQRGEVSVRFVNRPHRGHSQMVGPGIVCHSGLAAVMQAMLAVMSWSRVTDRFAVYHHGDEVEVRLWETCY